MRKQDWVVDMEGHGWQGRAVINHTCRQVDHYNSISSSECMRLRSAHCTQYGNVSLLACRPADAVIRHASVLPINARSRCITDNN